MIRINLLPSGRKKALAIPPILIYGAVSLIILIIIMVVWTVYLNSSISEMQAKVAVKQKKLNELKVVLREVENYERDNAEYRKKTQIIEKLKKNQIVPLRLLDEVSDKLPEGVWLTSLTDTAGTVNIKGFAFSNSDLVGYIQNLKGSEYFVDVMLVESRQEEIDRHSVYKFLLSFKVKV